MVQDWVHLRDHMNTVVTFVFRKSVELFYQQREFVYLCLPLNKSYIFLLHCENYSMTSVRLLSTHGHGFKCKNKTDK